MLSDMTEHRHLFEEGLYHHRKLEQLKDTLFVWRVGQSDYLDYKVIV
jgi:hypothetical protein